VVDHRRTPSRKAYVLPGWFLSLSLAACVVGVIGLGWVVFFDPGGGSDDKATPAPAATTAATPTSTPSPTPSPSKSPTPSPKPKPTVDRSSIDVSVLNASRTVGLAKKAAARATAAGWTVRTIANWRTGASQTAVHYPAGRRSEAKLLAKDLGIDAVVPSTAGMRSDRLTVILLSLP
jgi:hypothetical protein